MSCAWTRLSWILWSLVTDMQLALSVYTAQNKHVVPPSCRWEEAVSGNVCTHYATWFGVLLPCPILFVFQTTERGPTFSKALPLLNKNLCSLVFHIEFRCKTHNLFYKSTGLGKCRLHCAFLECLSYEMTCQSSECHFLSLHWCFLFFLLRDSVVSRLQVLWKICLNLSWRRYAHFSGCCLKCKVFKMLFNFNTAFTKELFCHVKCAGMIALFYVCLDSKQKCVMLGWLA